MQNGLKKDIIKYHRYGDHKIKHFACERVKSMCVVLGVVQDKYYI